MPVDIFGCNGSENIHYPVLTVSYINKHFLRKDGTSEPTGPLNMNINRISNVVDLTGAQDTATKRYVDELEKVFNIFLTQFDKKLTDKDEATKLYVYEMSEKKNSMTKIKLTHLENKA